MKYSVFCSLGSNQGDRTGYLQRAVELLSELSGANLVLSNVYETKAWGLTNQPDFLNMCIGLQTDLSPADFLSSIIEIEQKLGRQRTIKWGPRTLDIDIILFDEMVIESEALVVPHPYMHLRKFVIQPLSEIAGNLVHPVLHQSVDLLNEQCSDTSNPVLIGPLF